MQIKQRKHTNSVNFLKFYEVKFPSRRERSNNPRKKTRDDMDLKSEKDPASRKIRSANVLHEKNSDELSLSKNRKESKNEHIF